MGLQWNYCLWSLLEMALGRLRRIKECRGGIGDWRKARSMSFPSSFFVLTVHGSIYPNQKAQGISCVRSRYVLHAQLTLMAGLLPRSYIHQSDSKKRPCHLWRG